jgi:hypothetical protein
VIEGLPFEFAGSWIKDESHVFDRTTLLEEVSYFILVGVIRKILDENSAAFLSVVSFKVS